MGQYSQLLVLLSALQGRATRQVLEKKMTFQRSALIVIPVKLGLSGSDMYLYDIYVFYHTELELRDQLCSTDLSGSY